MKEWAGAALILIATAAVLGLLGIFAGGSWASGFFAVIEAFALIIGTIGGGAWIGSRIVSPLNETTGAVVGGLVGFFLLLMVASPILSRLH